jgi:hypothetical protein
MRRAEAEIPLHSAFHAGTRQRTLKHVRAPLASGRLESKALSTGRADILMNFYDMFYIETNTIINIIFHNIYYANPMLGWQGGVVWE